MTQVSTAAVTSPARSGWFEIVDCYPNLLPFELTQENIEAFMKSVASAGATHVQINHVEDLMHPEALGQPDNVYLWFANFGAALDMFVTSDLNEGLYPRLYLDRNVRCLKRFAAAALRHQLKPILYLCEPRFVPERFFQRHPNLRGARVDNPVASRVPLFALCTDLPEVKAHYQQMMSKMMQLVPELAGAVIFTSDSGSGFDYNPYTYAGSNGAGFNQKFPLARRVSNWLAALATAGQQVNPKFTVKLTSGFPPEERAKILALTPPGVSGNVQGALSWTGGLEEQWAYHQKRFDIAALNRDEARQARLQDMCTRLEAGRVNGQEPTVHVAIPTYDYLDPLRYVPHPWEVVRLLQDYAAMGIKRIALWGIITSPHGRDAVVWDINRHAMLACFEDISLNTDALMQSIAQRWVGSEHAGLLVEAWRRCEEAITRRPLWNHFFGWEKQMLPGPLVPDLTALTAQEKSYYWGLGQQDLERVQGVGYFVPHEPDEANRQYVLEHEYRGRTLPRLEQSLALLEQGEREAPAAARAVFRCQREHVLLAYLFQRSQYNWFEAGRYLAPGKNPGPGRTMVQIIDDEIEVSQQMHQLMAGSTGNEHQSRLLKTFWSDHMMYQHGPGFTGFLLRRISVMQAHRLDQPRSLSERLAKMHQFLKDIG